MSDLKTTTLRLPDGLHASASAYAESLGLSLNALVAVALAEYVGARTTWRAGAPADLARQTFAAVEPGAAGGGAADAAASALGLVSIATKADGPTKTAGVASNRHQTEAKAPPAGRPVPRVGKSQPCPCGSGKPYGKCHGRAA